MSFFLNFYNISMAGTISLVGTIPVVIPKKNLSSPYKICPLCSHFCMLENAQILESDTILTTYLLYDFRQLPT